MKTTRDRILEYLNFKGINKQQFYKKTGLSNGFLDKTINPGSDKLDKILTAYPDLNLYWLVSEQGGMIIAPLTAGLIAPNLAEKIAPNVAPNVAPNAPKIAPIVAPKPLKKDENLRLLEIMPHVATIDTSNNEVICLVPYKAAAGYLTGYSDPEFIEGLTTMSLPGLNGGSHRAFEIRGQSMLPIHHSGSISIGRHVESLNDIRDRRVYIVVTKNDGIVLKRVLNRIKDDGKLILMSDNDNKKDYPNYPLDPEEVLEMWYWRGSFIRESPEPGNIYKHLNDIEARLTLMQANVQQLQASKKGINRK